MAGNMALHRGSRPATFEEVEAVTTPEGTNTWKPVAHGQIAREVKGEIAKRNLTILKESYTLGAEGRRFFGVIDTTDDQMPGGIAITIGMRNSNDKKLSVGLAAGTRVFVCDNLAFRGEVIRYQRHTPKIDVTKIVDGVVGEILEAAHFEGRWLSGLKEVEITDRDAKALMMDLWKEAAISERQLKVVHSMYFDAASSPANPIRQYVRDGRARMVGLPKEVGGDGAREMTLGDLYGPRTAWTLYNVVTESFKGMRGDAILRRSGPLNRVFGQVASREKSAPAVERNEEATSSR